MHFRHLAPRPVDYAYPYPDFIQLIYWANAGEFSSLERKQGQYEVESGFRPVDEAITLGLPTSQQSFLIAALNKYDKNAAAGL